MKTRAQKVVLFDEEFIVLTLDVDQNFEPHIVNIKKLSELSQERQDFLLGLDKLKDGEKTTLEFTPFSE